jgi:hypothetical protein
VSICSKQAYAEGQTYSITSLATESSDGGTVRPSAFDVIRLMTRSKSRKYGRRGVPSAYKTFSSACCCWARMRLRAAGFFPGTSARIV